MYELTLVNVYSTISTITIACKILVWQFFVSICNKLNFLAYSLVGDIYIYIGIYPLVSSLWYVCARWTLIIPYDVAISKIK